MTKVELEIVLDPDMHFSFEKSIWDEVSYISKGYSKASNRYLNSYDPKQESQQIILREARSLYGYAMSMFLPTSGLKWIDPGEFDMNKCTSNSS